MSKIYQNGEYLDNNPSWHEEDSPWKANQITKMLERNSIVPGRVCEVGCGAGGILHHLSKKYPESDFVGYEISPQAFNKCLEKSSATVKFKNENLFNSNDEYYDLVMAIDVFEHVEDCFDFLRELKKKAKYKVFHIPLDLSVQTVLRSRPIMSARDLVGHIHYFTKETALATLSDTGYSVIDQFYTAGSLDLPNRGWKSDLLQFPRKIAFSLNQDWTVRLFGGFSLMVLAE